MTRKLEDRIREKLAQALQPLTLEIVNESPLHKGHAGDNGSGESHYRVMIVSNAFEGKGRIERQRMVYSILNEEMRDKIHALSLKTMTPDEYA